jgi:hypothetical protein
MKKRKKERGGLELGGVKLVFIQIWVTIFLK